MSIRSKNKPRKFVPKRRWLYPAGCEREYQRFARRLTRELWETVKAELLPALAGLVKRNPLRAPRGDEVSDDIANLIAAASRKFFGRANESFIKSEVGKIAGQTATFNEKQFRQVMRSALQVDIFVYEPWLKDLVNVWVAENVRLIKTVPERYFGDIEGIARRGLMEGTPVDEMAEEMKRHVDIATRRAELISRDQIGKLNGDLTEYRQTGAGIDEYVWSTSKDARVRPEHSEREGRVYKWSDPPKGGHPGKAIHCRCVALPVIDVEDLDKIQYVAMAAPGGR